MPQENTDPAGNDHGRFASARVYSPGNSRQQEVILVKTGTGGISATVPVYRPVRDEKTGLDRITLPAVAGAPGRIILINPGTAPSGPWHTGNPAPAAPVTPVHTGTEIKQADSIVTTTFPADDMPLQDFIYWQPDATGTGVEAIYVMVSSPRDMPGKVSGKGEQVGEGWLNKAGQELGAPVPVRLRIHCVVVNLRTLIRSERHSGRK